MSCFQPIFYFDKIFERKQKRSTNVRETNTKEKTTTKTIELILDVFAEIENVRKERDVDVD